ncbi:MAG: CHAP domain-containing protein, partial [Deltaproteobacteria bacterium]|nr:CHAP domain-containing protein [Candidatus Kapabacteria bacterium]
DHLGNVRATVTDVVLDHSGDLDAELSTRTDYYPFGMIMGGRNSSADDAHRYGFNGKENDNEVKGEGVQQDYGFRIYDARVARFSSVDPLTKSYPSWSPYSFSVNSPVQFVDVFGLGAQDRIKKAASFIGTKYSMDAKLNGGKELRTGVSPKAFEFIDCSELVCRVMHADGVTKVVLQKGTIDLIGYLNDSKKFDKSLDSPKPGDIFLWGYWGVDKKTGAPAWKGHTGIVESVDDNGTIRTIEAVGVKHGTKRQSKNLKEFTEHAGWQGFYRPVSETPDGKLETASTPQDAGDSPKPDQKKSEEPDGQPSNPDSVRTGDSNG